MKKQLLLWGSLPLFLLACESAPKTEKTEPIAPLPKAEMPSGPSLGQHLSEQAEQLPQMHRGKTLVDAQGFSDLADHLFHTLPKTMFMGRAKEDVDYGPKGGYRTALLHLSSLIGQKDWQKIKPANFFLGGCQTDELLDLENKTSFGYHNPALLEQLYKGLDQELKTADWAKNRTMPAPFDRLLLQTWAYGQLLPWKDEAQMTSLKSQYQALMQKGISYEKIMANKAYEQFFKQTLEQRKKISQAYPQAFDYRDNDYEAEILAFWLRRTIDGSAPQWLKIINRLQAHYN